MASTASPSPATCQSTFEQGVALSLHLWEALSLAVQNNWGGPDSADKRDWFAGAVVDLFPDVSRLTPAQLQQKTTAQQTQPQQQAQSQPQSAQNGTTTEEPDQEDVEAVLLQVMLDEFEVNVDDESAFEVAEQVVRLRGECLRGKLDGVDALRRRWEGKKGNKVVFKKAEDQDGDETDWDTDDDEEEEEGESGEDVEMGEAPPAPPRREKEEPEVDEEGFTKVSRKKR
ncbi:Pre-rRNA-processing protein TSR2-domain-containing protein [Parachaetomium inaequale]|uniref:Pre-rRNA-processing protein TSR2-domain-containing protein n=1 Tax=Parachaetomium inaequale TaxID=2588326 RepID=A0AAN6SN19_9PEZI|nr:Pre-rRNA-processing protein TSR2-domain-containing protein [Parachaetomium inaequale]